MRIHASKGQHSIGIRNAGCHERVSHLCAIRIANIILAIQTEDKALARIHANALDDAVLIVNDFQNFFFFSQRNFGRKIIVLCFDGHFHQRRNIVQVFQVGFITGIIKDVSLRHAGFNQVILAQGKLPGFVPAIHRGDDGVHQFILRKPGRSVMAGNILGGIYLENGSFQRTILIDRLLVFIAPVIGMRLKAHQLRAGLFQNDFTHDRLICHGVLQQIYLAGIAHGAVAHKDGQLAIRDQVAVGSLALLNEIQAVGDGFGQRHFSAVIGVEGVNGLHRGIMHRLLHRHAIPIQQPEAGIGQRNRLPAFGVDLGDLDPVIDGFIVDDGDGRAGQILGASDHNVHGGLDRVSVRAFGLPQGINAVGQQLGHRIAGSVGGQVITLKIAGGLIGTGRAQEHFKFRVGFGRFHNARVIMHQVVAQEFDDGMFPIQDLVLLHALIGDDSLLGLQSGVAGVHKEMPCTGLVAGRR